MLMISILPDSKMPIYQQIYEFIKTEIKEGSYAVHKKLPSSRSLAQHLQISRSTVELAYHQLLSEGYIESIPKSGYYVADIGELMQASKHRDCKIVQYDHSDETIKYDFSPFTVDISAFPLAIWRKLSNQCMNDDNQKLFLLGDPQGDLELREVIADYLHVARSVNCEARQIIIGAGNDYLLQLLTKLLPQGSIIAMENPTYTRGYQILKGSGLSITPIAMKEDGLNICELENTTANVVYVTPSHQYPLGVVLPIKRRMELLAWAMMSENRYIIEDDHDSEFRYIGKPIPSLQGIDQNQRVIYMGTFSRAIAPAIRVGYMVLPEELYQVYLHQFQYYASTVSRIDQAIICEFLREGYFERHVNKMRKRYKNKHDLTLKLLGQFGSLLKITGENAGLYLVVEFKVPYSENELIRKAKQIGIKLYGLNKHYITKEKSKNPTILLGYANLSEQELIEGIRELHQLLL